MIRSAKKYSLKYSFEICFEQKMIHQTDTADTFNISARKKTKPMDGKHPYSTDHNN